MSVPCFEAYRTRLIVHRKLSFLSSADRQRIDDMCLILDRVSAAADATGYLSDSDHDSECDYNDGETCPSDCGSLYSPMDEWCTGCSEAGALNTGPATGLSPAPPVGMQVRMNLSGPEQKLRRESRRLDKQTAGTGINDMKISANTGINELQDEPLLTVAHLMDIQRALDKAFMDCGSSIDRVALSVESWGEKMGGSQSNGPQTSLGGCGSEREPLILDDLVGGHATLPLFQKLLGRYKGVRNAAKRIGDTGEVEKVDGLMKWNLMKLQGLVARLGREEKSRES
ncbi:hypothetical protein Cpir12675_002684 [Ceratocystis pirilliformis]|uniref:Uncharacterized protein n=1 Tax=Ceratocystis pirilliformis TaxID=259994 RepID=A0ABR3Z8T9_9PEZI